MNHAPKFWAAYVKAVRPELEQSFWTQFAQTNGDWWHAETIAHRVLFGLTYSHYDAIQVAHAIINGH